MKPIHIHALPGLRRWSLSLVLGLSLLVGPKVPAQTLTQSIQLQPGWNAIWLEAEPADNSPDAVFRNVPLISAWTWSERASATDFIQNPASAGWNRNQWLAWFPPGTPEAMLGNLKAILPGRAYLLRVGGTAPVTFQVTGRVALRPAAWVADQFNLRGLAVDSARPATFADYLRHSAAHWDAAQNSPTPVYRLQPDGQWVQVAPQDKIRRGEAYWIFSRGPSNYEAPFTLRIGTGNLLQYSALSYRVSVSLENQGSEPYNISFRPLQPGAEAVFLEEIEASGKPGARFSLVNHQRQLAPGKRDRFNIILDRNRLRSAARAALSSTGTNAPYNFEQVFEVSNQQGTVQLLAVTADGPGAGTNDTHGFAGLWIGTANVKAVGEAHNTNSVAPTPVVTPFPLRLLVHVDTNGTARLLREITLVHLPVTVTNAAPTNGAPATPTTAYRDVLLSDATLLGQYRTRYRQLDRSAVRRFTAVQFDDATTPAGVELVGAFGTNLTVRASLSIPSGHPTNPYYHKYHPDHDNLDATFKNKVVEDFAVTRDIELDLTPAGTGVPDYGVNGLDGTYRETVSGLHKVGLLAAGTFTLQRVSLVGDLNPPLSTTP